MHTIQDKNLMRDAIAMIELIFAIVIIGITLLSAPLLMTQASKSGYVALQQESISAAASQMGLILTRAWDEADANQTQASILTTTYNVSQNAALTNFTPSVKRVGMDENSSRITHYYSDVSISKAASSNFHFEGSDLDDIDDFNGNEYNLSVYLHDTAHAEEIDTAEGDYIDQKIHIAATVEYGDDVPRGVNGTPSANDYNATTITFSNPFFNTNVPAGQTSNIKLITVTLTTTTESEELNKTISLSAFSCNLGSYIVAGKSYP